MTARTSFGIGYRPGGQPVRHDFWRGSADHDGIVFELVSPPPATRRPCFTRSTDSNDGIWAGLTLDSAGNLYGTTVNGGDFGYGSAFELVNSSGSYSEQVLHSFKGGSDGGYVQTGLILDSAGNLYGTTWSGGSVAYAAPEPSSNW